MWLIFFFVIGVITVFVIAVVGILSLLFGGEDPYERELRAYDRNDELVNATKTNSSGTVDARSVHLHQHQHK